MARRTTLKDVAAEAGVSAAAVSLVLNGRPNRVSAETKKAIFAAAQRLNYVPNQTARSLVTNHSMLLALLVPDIENLFFASLAKALEDVLAPEGYCLIIANSDDSRAAEHTLMRTLGSRGIDGLFLIPSYESVMDMAIIRADVEAMTCPVVLVDRLLGQDWCDAVGSDNRCGGRLAARALLEAGHTRIGCITASSGPGSDTAREEGFSEELRRAGIELPPALRGEGGYRFEGGHAAADGIIDAGATAVFCCNDLMALGFVERMRERGLTMPGDISVIGYDNVIGRFGISEPMTTLDQNIPAIASAARDVMLARIASFDVEGGVARPAETRLIQPTLVARDTVRAAA